MHAIIVKIITHMLLLRFKGGCEYYINEDYRKNKIKTYPFWKNLYLDGKSFPMLGVLALNIAILDLVKKRLVADIEHLCRLGLVPVSCLQHR